MAQKELAHLGARPNWRTVSRMLRVKAGCEMQGCLYSLPNEEHLFLEKDFSNSAKSLGIQCAFI